MEKNNIKNFGFTLIELLVVISIIGLLAAVVLVSLNSARAKSRDARRISDVHQLQTALELYYNDCGGYPVTGTALNVTGGTQKLFSGTISGSTCSGGGFATGTASGNTYLGQTPANPTPNGTTYTYTGSASNYSIGFSLEGQTSNLGSGAHTATPSGIQ